jgi:hypothetical protein
MRLTTDRTYSFSFDADELWTRIGRVDDYGDWWPWLHHFDGHHLSAGDVWSCEVHPPVPYVVHFAVRLDEVRQGQSVHATISGDIEGSAVLHVEHDGPECRVRLVSELSPAKQSLRVMSIAARPVVRFGHNWILDVGVRQFRARSGSGYGPRT